MILGRFLVKSGKFDDQTNHQEKNQKKNFFSKIILTRNKNKPESLGI